MKPAMIAAMAMLAVGCASAPGTVSSAAVDAAVGAEGEAVLKVIDTFLLAIGNGDRELQKSVELPDGLLAIYRANDGVDGPVRRMPASDFQKPTPDHDPFVEMYWSPKVDVRGSFAQVWSPYVLRDNGAVVHCGINAFQLVKLEGAWKIQSALSSMEPAACDDLGAQTATGLRPRDGWKETPLQ
jgi:hypothetical protein